jgi:hypothetical protein
MLLGFTVTKKDIRYRLYTKRNGEHHAVLPTIKDGKPDYKSTKDVVIPRSQYLSALEAYQKSIQSN